MLLKGVHNYFFFQDSLVYADPGDIFIREPLIGNIFTQKANLSNNVVIENRHNYHYFHYNHYYYHLE